jgi:hypothetical protein
MLLHLFEQLRRIGQRTKLSAFLQRDQVLGEVLHLINNEMPVFDISDFARSTARSEHSGCHVEEGGGFLFGIERPL